MGHETYITYRDGDGVAICLCWSQPQFKSLPSSSTTIISFGQGVLEKLKCLLYKTDIKFLLQGAKFVLSWSKTRLHLAVSRVCH